MKHLFLASFIEIVIFGCLPGWTWTASTELSNKLDSSNNHTNRLLHLLNRRERSPTSMPSRHAQQRCLGCDATSEIGMQCTQQSLNHVKRYARELMCRPESTVVELEQFYGSAYSVKPTHAKVNRCNGLCQSSLLKCTPVETTFVKVPVILFHHVRNGIPKCVEYEIEEHVSCKCGCEVQKEHCSSRHRHEHCACKCMNQEDERRCRELKNAVWDQEHCRCDIFEDDADNFL